MKATLTLITAVALLLIGCQSNTVTPAKSKRAMQARQYDRIQKESDGSYSIIINGKAKYTELKYATSIHCGTKILMLDKHNQKKIIKSYQIPIFCDGGGLDIAYDFRAVDLGKRIKITIDVSNGYTKKKRKNILLASIPKSKADRIFFYNHSDHYTKYIVDASGDVERIYYQKGSKYGILAEVISTGSTSGKLYRFKQYHTRPLYDALNIVHGLVKVEQSGRVGYLDYTDIKYKSIGIFEDGLARFSLADGRSGWVTQQGKREFYD